jgi:hypothetical protein
MQRYKLSTKQKNKLDVSYLVSRNNSSNPRQDTIVYRYFNIDNYRVNVFELFVCLSIF